MLTLLHFSDLHFWDFGTDGDLFPKRAAGLFNLALRRKKIFPAHVALALTERLAGETADAVLFSGDVSTTALASEFRMARAVLAPLFQRFGRNLICIPGNHDRYTPRAARRHLFEREFLQRRQDYPFTLPLGDHWSVIGFDCSVPRLFSSRGAVSSAALKDLVWRMAAEKKRGKRIIVMGHYPVVYPPSVKIKWDHALSAADRRNLREALADGGAELYLHGHKHLRWGVRDGATLHLNAGSAGMLRPSDNGAPERSPGYMKIKIEADGAIGVESHWLAHNQWSSAPLQVN